MRTIYGKQTIDSLVYTIENQWGEFIGKDNFCSYYMYGDDIYRVKNNHESADVMSVEEFNTYKGANFRSPIYRVLIGDNERYYGTDYLTAARYWNSLRQESVHSLSSNRDMAVRCYEDDVLIDEFRPYR